MKLVDTHAHLYADQFADDLEEVIARSKKQLKAVFLPNIDVHSIDPMMKLVQRDPSFFHPMMGLHPCYISEKLDAHLQLVEEQLSSYPFAGIGETGLDLFRPAQKQSIELQKISLEQHIEWAKEYQLPIILHARDAIDETYELIAKHHDEKLRGIFHCFDGTIAQARKIHELGSFKIGIGGIATYRKEMPEILKQIPLSLIVLETDSPYLAPVPHRRTRNESSYLRFIASKLVEIYELSFNEIAHITGENAAELFPVLKDEQP